MNIAIITGANKGLGAAFFDKLYDLEHFDLVVSISRRTSAVQNSLIEQNDSRFLFIEADLSMLMSSAPLKVLENYCDKADKVTFINNAGVINPVGSVGDLKNKAIFNAIQVNATAPVIIMNYIMDIFSGKNLTFLNISSGAADYPIDGWSIYCSAKAFVKMFVRSLEQQETNNPLIRAFNVDPGVINTDMQKDVRDSNVPGFTKHADFVALKTSGVLQEADVVVDKILSDVDIIG